MVKKLVVLLSAALVLFSCGVIPIGGGYFTGEVYVTSVQEWDMVNGHLVVSGHYTGDIASVAVDIDGATISADFDPSEWMWKAEFDLSGFGFGELKLSVFGYARNGTQVAAAYMMLDHVDRVANPTFSVPYGVYDAFSLEFDCETFGATIFYSTDSAIPNESYIQYSGSINIDDHTTIWAYASLDDMIDSEVSRCDYAIESSLAGGNLIGNGDFSMGETLWYAWSPNEGGMFGSSQVTYNGDTMAFSVPETGPEFWRSGIVYMPGFGGTDGSVINLVQGNIYTISFDASSPIDRKMIFRISEKDEDLDGDGDPWTAFLWREVELSSVPTTYTIDFGMTSPSYDSPDIAFFFGEEAGDVTLDNVSIIETVGGPIDGSNMPDAAFRQAVADKKDVDPADLTTAHLADFKGLWFSDFGISNIEGLELFPSITGFGFPNNTISSLEPANDLDHIEWLVMNNNNLDNAAIGHIATLDFLRALHIADNTGITSLSGIEALTELEEINLEGVVGVTDLSPLSGASLLKHISISDTDIDYTELSSTFSPTNHPNLKSFKLSNELDAFTADISTLSSFIGSFEPTALVIEEFFSTMNDAAFATFYTNAMSYDPTAIEVLNFGENGLTSASMAYIANLVNVRSLRLNEMPSLNDISALSSLSNLRILEVNSTSVTDLEPIRSMYNAGSFQFDEKAFVNVESCGLDVSPGSNNRDVVEFLMDRGIDVAWEEGNSTYNGAAFLTSSVVPDSSVQTALEDATGLSFGDITFDDAASIAMLNIVDNANNLTGIEFCTGVIQLGIGFDINAVDLSPINEMASLINIYLASPLTTHLSGLTTVGGLEAVFIDGTAIDENDLAILTPVNFPDLWFVGIDSQPPGTYSGITAVVDALVPSTQVFAYALQFGMDDADFEYFYDSLVAPRLGTNLADFSMLEMYGNSFSNASLVDIATMTGLQRLHLGGSGISDITALSSLTNLQSLFLDENPVAASTLYVLENLYDAGAFQAGMPPFFPNPEVSLINCGLDLTTGSVGLGVVDYLVGNGVTVHWEEGNIID